MNDLVPQEHLDLNVEVRALLAKYAEIEMLVQIGEYKTGSDKRGDKALKTIPKLNAFFAQKTSKKIPFIDTLCDLREALK